MTKTPDEDLSVLLLSSLIDADKPKTELRGKDYRDFRDMRLLDWIENNFEHVKAVLTAQATAQKIDAGRDAWRPISEAPRDGSRVLLYSPEFAGCMSPKDLEDFLEESQYTDYYFVGWFTNNNWYCCEYDAFEQTPTHWMPLPAPPEDAG